MIVTYIRSSSYNNYDYCQLQYFITYVLGHRSTSGKKAQLGTIVHKVMECLAVCKKRLQGRQTKTMKVTDDFGRDARSIMRTLENIKDPEQVEKAIKEDVDKIKVLNK